MRRQSAFSLVELLAIVAITVIGAGILMPLGSMVRRTAVRVACGSNLRQLSTALIAYAADFEGYLPGKGNYGDENARTSPAWFDRLPPYVADRKVRSHMSIFQCAGFQWSGPRVFSHATPKSFKMNTYVDGAGRPRNYLLGSLEDEGRLMLFVDAVAGETGMGQWGDCPTTGVDDSRHRGAVNVLYADGHSRSVVRAPAGADRRRWEDALTWRSQSWVDR